MKHLTSGTCLRTAGRICRAGGSKRLSGCGCSDSWAYILKRKVIIVKNYFSKVIEHILNINMASFWLALQHLILFQTMARFSWRQITATFACATYYAILDRMTETGASFFFHLVVGGNQKLRLLYRIFNIVLRFMLRTISCRSLYFRSGV